MLIPRALPGLLSDTLFKLVLMGLAFAAATLLLRDALGLADHVPLDPREGHNAYLAFAAAGGAPLYPQGLMVNSDPPLSFYIMGALGRITGDPIVAGRLVSLIAFFAMTGSLIVSLREMGTGVLAALFASLFLGLGLLAVSDYAVMNDGQLLGHAMQLAGLSLLLPARRDAAGAALLMAAGIFVKADLMALPLAALIWLGLQDRRAAMIFAGTGLAVSLLGFAAAWVFLHVNLFAVLTPPRHWAMENFIAGAKLFLAWAGTALIVTAAGLALRPRDAALRLTGLYALIALLLGGLGAWRDGADAHVFFDAAIALSLGAGLGLARLPQHWRGTLAVLVTAPLGFTLAQYHAAANFAHGEAFAREAPLDIGFLEVHPGPALCEDLTLCYWAQKTGPVDVFNLGQAIKTGAGGDAGLAHLLETQYFDSIALKRLKDSPLGPHLRDVLLAHYRVNHADDNGIFLERRF